MDKQSSGILMQTPSKSGRAFGTRLSANSPLPLQSQREQQKLLQQHPSLSKSAKKKRLESISETATSGKKKKETRLQSQQDSGNHAVAERNSGASAYKPTPTTTATTTSIDRGGIRSTAATTPASTLQAAVATPLSTPGSGAVQRGKNLMHHFNCSSPSIDNDYHEVVAGRRMRDFSSPGKGGDGLGEKDVPATTAIAASSSSSASSSWKEFTRHSHWQGDNVGDGGKGFTTPLSTYHQSTNVGISTKSGLETSFSSSLLFSHSKATSDDAAVVTNSLLYPPTEQHLKKIATTKSSSTSSKKNLFTSSQSYSSLRWPTASSSLPCIASLSGLSISSANVGAESAVTSSPSAEEEATVLLMSDLTSKIPSELSIGPSEYAIQFPAGQKSLHLEFEPVTQMSGRMTGCGIAKILPEFFEKLKSNAIRYLREPLSRDSSGNSVSVNDDRGGGIKVGKGRSAANEEPSESMIQVNDLVVSINGISVLSRKYDIIMELLHHEQFHNDDRIIVFRSIEKLWRSRSNSYSHQFSSRTMRHLRTGKRIATALNDDVMLTEDGSELLLRTWVETPTQVSVARNRKNRFVDGGEGENVTSTDEMAVNEELAAAFTPSSQTNTSINGTKPPPIINSTIRMPALGSSSVTLGGVDDIVTVVGSQSFPFSPSNVKRILQSRPISGGSDGGRIAYFSPLTTKSSAVFNMKKRSLCKSSSGQQHQTLDVRLGDHKHGNGYNTSPSSSSHMMERIGKALMGKEIPGDMGADFEHSLRLKKAVIEEIKYAYFLLLIGEARQRSVDTRQDRKSSELASKDVLNQSHHQEVAAVVKVVGSATATESSSLNGQTINLSPDLTDSFNESKGQERNFRDSQARISDFISRSATERASGCVCDAEQVCALKERVSSEEQKAFDCKKNHAAIVTNLEQRISAIETERDDARLELEKVRLVMVRAKSSADAILTAMDEERSSFQRGETTLVKKVCSLDELVTVKVEKAADSRKSLIVVESDREVELLEPARERLAQPVLVTELAICQVKSSQGDAIHAEHISDLKERLGSDREEAFRELKERQLVLSGAESISDQLNVKIDSVLNDAVTMSLSSKLHDELRSLYATKIKNSQLLTEIEKHIVRYKVMESEKKNFEDKLERVTSEKEVAEGQLRDLNEKLERLAEQVVMLSEEKNELEMRVGKTTADLYKAEETVEQQRLHFHQYGGSCKEMIRSLEKRLEIEVEKLNVAESEALQSKELYFDLQRDFLSLTNSETELKDQLNSSEGYIQQFKNERKLNEVSGESIEIERTELIKRIRSLELENSEEKALKSEAKREVQSLTSALKSARLKCEIESRLTEKETMTNLLKSEIDVLKERERDLTGRLELSEECNATSRNELQTKLAEFKADSVENKALIADLQSKLDSADRSLVEANINIQSLEQDCSCWKKQVNDLELLLTNADQDNSQQKDEVQSLTIELTGLRREKDLLTDDMKSKETEILMLNDRMGDLSNQLDTVSRLKSEIESRLTEKETMTNLLKSEIDVLKERERDLTGRLELSEECNATSRNELQTKLAEFKADSVENKALIADLQSKLDSADRSLVEANINIQSLEQDCSCWKKQVNDLELLLTNADQDNSQQKDEVQSLTIELTGLRREKDLLTDDMKSKETEILMLNDRMGDLSNQLDTVSRLKSEIESRLTEKETMTNLLKSEIDVLKERERDLTGRLELSEECNATSRNELQTKLAEFKADSVENKALIADLQSKLDSADRSLVEANINIQSLEQDCSCWKKQVNDLELLLTNADQDNSQQKDEVQSLTIELTGLRREKDLLTDDMKSKETEILMLNDRMGDLSNQLDTVSRLKSEIESRLTEKETMTNLLKSEIDVLKERERDLTGRLELSEECNATSRNELQTKLAEFKADSVENKALIADLQSKLDSADRSLVEANINIQSLEQDCSCWKKQVNDLELLLTNADQDNSQQKDEVQSLTIELTGLRREKDLLTDDMKSKETEILMLNDRMGDLSNQLDTVSRLKSEIESRLTEKETMTNLLKSEIDVLKERERDLTGRLELSEECNATSRNELQTKLAEFKADSVENKALIADLQSKLDSADRSLVEANINIQSLEQDCSCWKKQVNDLELLLTNADQDNSQQKDEVRSLTIELTGLRREKDLLTDDMKSKETEILMLNDRMGDLSNQLDTVSRLKSEIESRLTEKETMTNLLKSEIDVLKERERDLTGRLELSEECNATSRNELQTKLAEFKADSVENKALIADLQSKLDSADRSLVEANINIQSLEQDCSCWKKQVNDLELLLTNADQDNSQQKDEVQSLTIELTGLRREKDLLTDDMKSKETEILMLNDRMGDLSNQLDTVSRLKSEIESRLTEKETMTNLLKSEIDVLKERERDLTGRLELSEECNATSRNELQTKLAEFKADSVENKALIADLQSKLDSADRSLVEANINIQSLEQDCSCWKKQVNDLELLLTNADQDNSQQKDEVQSLTIELTGLRREKDLLTDDMKSKETEILMLNDRMGDLSNQLDTVSRLKSEIESRLTEKETMTNLLKSEIDVLKERERDLTGRLELSEECNATSRNELQTKLAEFKADSVENKALIADLQSKLDSADRSLVEANINIQSLEQDCSCWKKQVNDLELLLTNADQDNSQQKDEVRSLTIELTGLRREKDLLTDDMKSKETEILMLNDRMGDLSNQLDTVSRLKSEIESRLTEKETMTNLLKSEIDVLKERERDLTGRLELSEECNATSRNELQTKLAEFKADSVENKALIADLQSKLDSADRSLVEANINIQSLEQDCSCWKKQVNDLELLLTNADQDNSQQKDEVQSLTIELTGLRREKDLLTDDMKSKETEILMLNDRMGDLSNQLDTVSRLKSEIESRLTEKETMTNLLKSEIDVLKERERDLTGRLELSEECNATSRNELQTKLAEFKADSVENKALIADLQSKLDSADRSLVEANINIQSLEQDCSCWKKQVNDLELLLTNADQDNSQQKDEVQSLTIELTGLRREKDLLTDDMKSKETEILMLNDRMGDLSNQLDTVSRLKSEIESRLTEKETMTNLLKSEIDVLKERERDLTGRLELSEECNATSRNELQTKLAEFKADSVENKALIADLQSKLDSADRSLVEANINIQSLEQDCSCWKKQVNDLELLLTNADQDNSQQKDEVRSLTIELTGLRREKDLLTDDMKSKETEILMLNDRMGDLSNQLDTVSRLKSEIESRLTEKETMTNLLKSEIHYCGQTSEVLTNENSHTTIISSLKMKDAEIHSLRSQLREMKTIFEDLNIGFRKAEAQCQSLIDSHKVRVDELLSRNNELTASVENLSAHVKSIEAKSRRDKLSHEVTQSQLLNDIRDLRNSVSGKSIKYTHLANKLNDKNSEFLNVVSENECGFETMTLAVKSMEQEICHLTNELSSANQAISLLQSERSATEICLTADLENARKPFEEEREHMNGRIKGLQKELTDSMEALRQQRERIAKIEGIHASDMVLWRLKLSEANQTERDLRERINELTHLLKDRQMVIDSLAVAKREHKESLSEIATSHQSNIERIYSAHDRKIKELQLTFTADRDASERKVELAINKLSQETKQLNEELARKDKETKALTSIQSVIESENEKMKLKIQQQQDLLSQLRYNYENKMKKMQESLEIATTNLAHEKSSHESKILSLQDMIDEKCLLNRSLVARLEVESILRKRDDKFDKIFETVGIMKNACDEYCAVDSSQNSETDEMRITLKSCEKMITLLSVDLSLAQDEIVSLKAEIECAKEIGQSKIMFLREEYSEKLSALVENIMSEKASAESDRRSFQYALHQLAICIAHEDQDLPIEALPKMTALLKPFSESYQQKVEHIFSLQSGLQNLNKNENHLNDTSDLGFSSPPGSVTDILPATTQRQDAQSTEIAKLEEQCLRMKEELRKFGDIQNELKAKQDYVTMLKESKIRLEVKCEILKKENDDIHHRFADLEKSCKILRQQKLTSESLRNEVVTAVNKLADIVTGYCAELEGFPNILSSRQSWSENMNFVVRFIAHISKMNQKYLLEIEHMRESTRLTHPAPISGQILIEASTSNAKESKASAVLMNLASQHCDILEDIKSMKNSIAIVMSSPKLLTPVKHGRQNEGHAKMINDCDEDLYSDLLRAHEQLESLSAKIELFQKDQIHWKEWEAYFKRRISELEQENQIMKSAPSDLSKSKMKETGAVLIFKFQHRYNQMVVQRAFQSWSTQARMFRGVCIAKQVAKELAKTRKTVLILKTHFNSESHPTI
ncbi:hypothetical protein ACHAXA_004696 [Cyclostephanos tholiformis]|uniref:PDZ domain-containing protein n=1 Tax=Cyclostephanos tholiformis TaxID=382380 RepID=A0ABD3R805_9STRA